MAITPTAADPFALGTDIALLGDLNPVWGLVSGFTNLGYAIARRLNAVLGSLFYDLGYGFDLNDLVNQGLTPSDVGRIAQAIAGQCLLDERVQTCRAALSLNAQTSTLTIAVSGTIATGQAFQFILSANGLTVALITVNGTTISSTPPATVTGPTTVIIGGGGSSTPGAPGPPGPAGSASQDVPIEDVESQVGSEDPQLQTQKEIVWGALPASVTLSLTGMYSSVSGTATFRVRINGSDGAADGTIELTITATSPSATQKTASATIANPGSTGRIIITAQSSGATVDCLGRGQTLTIR
jgi:hypothetical protein